MKNILSFLALAAWLLLQGSNLQAALRTGLLTVDSSCLTPEGCGPKFKLWDRKLKNFKAISEKSLQSQNIQTLQERIITIHTKRGQTLVAVKKHSSLPFHDFLREQADQFTATHAPCMAGWDKTYSWDLRRSHSAELKVTLTKSEGGPSLTLVYNGNTGHLQNQSAIQRSSQLCAP